MNAKMPAGPYTLDDDGDVCDQKGNCLALIYGADDVEHAAIGKFFAAGPDLYKALWMLIAQEHPECDEPNCSQCLPWQNARAALAKASGE